MTLIEPDQGPHIAGLKIPSQLYWVLIDPIPLAGMRLPSSDWPWKALHDAGFDEVVSLHRGRYDPRPLRLAFSAHLEDLVHGGDPRDEGEQRTLVAQAVNAVMLGLESKHGIVVHCYGGRGRTGTVIGCVLRQLGFPAEDAISFLDRVHKERGKDGWPESEWQARLVRTWGATA
ncbi:protein-tyrosine phosphatase family protein [Limnochorda pilosa]|uniref:protein-tyrosine phosphatase family protein n=1 Tax=Limnochorda pilosa TaxID=1555112 RepID=UPI0011873143